MQQQDADHLPVELPPPYSDLPPAPPGASVEPGKPIKLDNRQQEAVVVAVMKWMKDPGSVAFGEMAAVRNSHGLITVCGQVNGRNSAGTYLSMSPYIGAFMGKPTNPEFVVVDIGSFGRQRAEVQSLCKESGIASDI